MPAIGISFQSDKSLPRYRELAALVDRYDFATVSVYQDLFFQPPWPALLQFGELTRRPLVGPAVVNPYLTHPALVAANLALLDEVSGGRAYLGVGRGAFFDAIEVAQPRPLAAMKEMVELVQRFLVGDRTPYRGEIFRASERAYLKFPVPGRRLPVLIGGWGEATVRLAGAIGDVLKVGGTANAESASWFRARLDEGALRAGRDPREVRLSFGAVTVVDRDRGVAEALARRSASMYVAVAGRLDPVFTPPEDELRALESALAAGDEDRASRALATETLRKVACFGAPEEVALHIQSMFDAGVDLFELGTPHGVDEADAVRLLGEEVLPRFDLSSRSGSIFPG
jgi:5,10-methylenetetrahydromethanopterin reductase